MAISTKRLTRNCLVCGKKISVILRGSKYINGHYFGKFKLPLKPGKYKKLRTTRIVRTKMDVVKWTGKEKGMEYWECDKCFEEATHKCWLKEKTEKLFGKKCKEYESTCPTCQAWFIYETILEDNRDKL